MSNLVIPIVLLAAMTTITASAYQYGKRTVRAELEAEGLTAYIEVMEAIRNENVDLSNNAAVTAELCRLAGFEPDAPECGGL